MSSAGGSVGGTLQRSRRPADSAGGRLEAAKRQRSARPASQPRQPPTQPLTAPLPTMMVFQNGELMANATAKVPLTAFCVV